MQGSGRRRPEAAPSECVRQQRARSSERRAQGRVGRPRLSSLVFHQLEVERAAAVERAQKEKRVRVQY